MPSRTGRTPPDGRPALIGSLAVLTILAWVYVVHVAQAPGMAADPATDMMDMMDMPAPATAWAAAATLLGLFGMWAAMMVGMMLPSVLPNVLLFSAMARQRRASGQAPLSVPAFVGGYLLVWIGFSLLAALLQTRLRVALLPLASHSRSAAIAAGLVLLLTGVYQWTRFKAVCLSHCRSPLAHFAAHWREGLGGALRMGAGHGLLCLGCCWLLMGLLFVGGVMNTYWIAGLALLVLLEKIVPRGDMLGRIAGAGLAVWGLLLIVGGQV
jgi:predicted metal-binding membrane protein